MLKAFTTFRFDLYIIFGFSLIVILTIELFLIKIPELFPGGEMIGKIVLKICYSMLASIIFYFIAIHLKETEKRKKIVGLLSIYLDKIIVLKNTWMSELYFIASSHSKEIKWPQSQSGTITNYYPSVKEIEKLSEFIPFHKTRSHEKDWIDRINRLQNAIQVLCKSILVLDNNLTANEISLIGELNSCDLFTKVSFHKSKQENGHEVANENISFIEPELQSFFKLIEKIEKEIIAKL